MTKPSVTAALLLSMLMQAGIILHADAKQNNDFSATAEKTLEETWATIIKYNFKDSAANEKWQKIYRDARPAILKSKNSRELITSVNKMIRRLRQSHISLMPPLSTAAKKAAIIQTAGSGGKTSVSEDDRSPEFTSGKKEDILKYRGMAAGTGIRTCVTDNRLCVLAVRPNSAAASAGIKTGDIIESINGYKFDVSAYSDYSWSMIANEMLTGNYFSPVRLTISRPGEKTARRITLRRTTLYGPWLHLGVMPRTAGRTESAVLKGGIGYIYLTPCFPQQVIKMHKLITEKLRNCKGLIIDLRDNPGGIMFMAHSMAGWLSDKEIYMGKMQTKDTVLEFRSYPQKNAFTGPLAILINNGTYSTAEVFAAGMQDSGRAKLFGTVTGGKCLPSVFLELSTGYRLQTVFGDFIRHNGKHIEGCGVSPDFTVEEKYSDLTAGIDTVKEAARKYLADPQNTGTDK